MKIRTNRKGAFTLTEIVIVVAIIGLLAAICVPNWVKSREAGQLKGIVSNLRLIESSKDQWALEQRKGTGDQPTAADLTGYLKNNTMPTPVASETYNINPIGTSADATVASKIGDIPAGGTVTLP